jgi:hypothetical protein
LVAQQNSKVVREHLPAGEVLSTANPLPVRRLAAEFTVIVVGVLLALAVDRWVASIDDHERQVVFLTALRTDFEANRALAQSNGLRHQRLEELGSVLLAALESGRRTDAAEQIVLAAELSGYIWSESYARGAWDDANSTGITSLLADPALRIAVSEFYRREDGRSGLMAEFQEHYMSYRYMARELVSPNLRVEMNQAFPGWEGDFTAGPLEYLARQDLTSAVTSILGTPRLAVPLADVVMARGVTARIADHDAERAAAILRMIDREFGAL